MGLVTFINKQSHQRAVPSVLSPHDLCCATWPNGGQRIQNKNKTKKSQTNTSPNTVCSRTSACRAPVILPIELSPRLLPCVCNPSYNAVNCVPWYARCSVMSYLPFNPSFCFCFQQSVSVPHARRRCRGGIASTFTPSLVHYTHTLESSAPHRRPHFDKEKSNFENNTSQ